MKIFRGKGFLSTKLLVAYSAGVLFLINISISSADERRASSPGPLKPNTFTKLSKTRYSSGKQKVPVKSVSTTSSLKSERKVGVSAARSYNGGNNGIDQKDVLARQGWGWGGGWPSSYGGGGGGSYDVYTIIAVAAFAALFGALVYELLGGSLRRSLDTTPTLNLPPVTLGLDSEKFPEVMVKIGDWIANSSWFDNIGNNSRGIREIGEKMGVRKWFEAYKKDPVEYQCIRKMACETLASSQLAAKSLKSNLGGVFLTVFGNFMENGDQLRELVSEVVGNPKKCEEMVVGGYCEEN